MVLFSSLSPVSPKMRNRLLCVRSRLSSLTLERSENDSLLSSRTVKYLSLKETEAAESFVNIYSWGFFFLQNMERARI